MCENPEYPMSEMNELLVEYKEKCEEVLRNSVNAEISQIKKENKFLKERNTELHNDINNLKKLYAEESYKNKTIALDNSIIDIFKNQISSKETNEDKNKSVYALFNLLFDKDYNERFSKEDNEEFILGCLVEFYSHKEDIIKIFKTLGYASRYDWNKFILPAEWTVADLTYFFNNIDRRSNTNGTYFEDNLKFWKNFAYGSAKKQCEYNYSNIPWQFVLSNKHLKKYLKTIGELINNARGWQFIYIDKYLDLSDDEIKIILNEIDFVDFSYDDDYYKFIKRNIHLLNEKQLEIVFENCKNRYDFSCDFNFISKLPMEFIKKVIKNNPEKFRDLLNKNYNKYFSIDQKEILFKIYIESLKKKKEQED